MKSEYLGISKRKIIGEKMKKIIIIIGLILLGTQILSATVTVDGFCFLQNTTNYTGTKVLFIAISPSANTDSTYTNTDGSFLMGLSEGIYTVQYSHDGWQPYTIPDGISLFEDTTLDDVTLSIGFVEEVSGPQSGIWISDYIYKVIGDIFVNNGDSLIIQPGVTVKFMDYYSFTISGKLIAEGTENDSILFTSGKATPFPDDWNQIKLDISSDSNSIISYAKIKYAYIGILCDNSSPTISNNTINNNHHAGIYPQNFSSPTISHNTISNNNNSGIYCMDSCSPTISNNNISNNNSYGIVCQNSSSATISDNTIINNRYPGISCLSSSPTVNNNNINNNSNGVYCSSSYSSPTINNNTISNNEFNGISCQNYSSPIISNNNISSNECDGILCDNSFPTISNNNISNNNYNGIYCWDSSSPTISYNTISNNEFDGIRCKYFSSPTISNNTISSNIDNGIYCMDYSSPNILNNILYDNLAGILSEDLSPSSLEYNLFWFNSTVGSGNLPPYFGQIITVNVNGDSCDTYYNLFMDPLFEDPSNGDYHLSWDNYPTQDNTMSPCIDAGDPSSPLDPDGTIADMGAYYFDQNITVDEPQEISNYMITNYPNPISSNFNNLSVSFSLHKPGKVKIQLFNVKGQLVSSLINEDKNIGDYVISHSINELSSGIYFTRMSVDGVDKEIRKVVLLR